MLLRFRKQPVAIVCDTAEIYMTINIPETDRPYHRFLWRSINIDQIPEYEFNSVVFEVNSTQFQALFVTRKHAAMDENVYLRAAETVFKSTYIDESLYSVKSDIEGIGLYEQFSE